MCVYIYKTTNMDVKNLGNLPVDIIQRVTENLDQQERITVSLASKELEGFYPKSLEFFCQNTPIEEYHKFARCVIEHDIDTIDVVIDPAKWNHLESVLGTTRFKKVGIFPEDHGWIGDRCWIPQADDVTSGFITEGSKIGFEGDEHRIEFNMEYHDMDSGKLFSPPEPVPWIHPKTLAGVVTTVELQGTFTCLERIRPELINQINVVWSSITKDAWRHIIDFDMIWLKECTFADECEKLPFQGTFLYAHPSVYKNISSLPKCRCVWLDLEWNFDDQPSPLPSVYTVYEEPIEMIEVFGNVVDASLEDIKEFVNTVFPNARTIKYTDKKY